MFILLKSLRLCRRWLFGFDGTTVLFRPLQGLSSLHFLDSLSQIFARVTCRFSEFMATSIGIKDTPCHGGRFLTVARRYCRCLLASEMISALHTGSIINDKLFLLCSLRDTPCDSDEGCFLFSHADFTLSSRQLVNFEVIHM